MDAVSDGTASDVMNDVIPRKRHIAAKYDMPPDHLAYLMSRPRRTIRIAAGRTFVRRGTHLADMLLVVDGWIARSQYLTSGARQISEFVLPGDIILPSATGDQATTSNIEALTDVTADLIRIDLADQRLETLDIFVRVHEADAEELRVSITDLGRRSAVERLANMLWRLDVRLSADASAGRDGRVLNVTQETLADLAGLSLVHTNKTLKWMQDQGLVERRNGKLLVASRSKMKSLCEDMR
ncbi:Crp/Fnr family transcriptional regulator [Litoreibacter roseus]|uniref:Crp/Fnr family transcriptional regulator n=2 Tax=Litoreibacter roseus TaxID=2601869 RepID=A0A6N6JLR6_9RHOB|nr:Crp/Fnr family transcriptional regulator [Litoreibacter roseus]